MIEMHWSEQMALLMDNLTKYSVAEFFLNATKYETCVSIGKYSFI